jgi:hypothetical protein
MVVRMRKRRREDLTVARRLSAEFALGDVRGVTRSRGDRLIRAGSARFGGRAVVAGGIALLLFLAFLVSTALVHWPPVLAIVIDSVTGGVGVGYFVGGIVLNHSFAPGTQTDRVFWFTGGVAHLTAASPEPRVLRWEEVDSVTATLLDEAFQHYGWYYTCTLRGRTGSEITLTGYDKATVGNSLGRRLVSESALRLGARFVPPLIEVYETGEPAIVGGWAVDQTGISATESGFVTRSCSWTAITRITMTRIPPKTGPIEQIHIYTGGRQPAIGIGLSDIPNGIFLPSLIAHAAASKGIDVEGGPVAERRLPPADRSSGLPAQPG